MNEIVDQRLAALEQRLNGLIDMEADVTSGAIGWSEYRARLAALRAPGATTLHPEVARLQVVVGTLTNERDRAELALATARRERDEAMGVVRRYLAWVDDAPGAESLETIGADFRALVADQPSPDPRDAEIERLKGRCRAAAHALVDAVGSATPANVEELAQRAATEIETLRAKLAEAEAKADFQHSMKMAIQLDNGRHILQGAGVDMYSKSLEAGIRELAEKRGAYVSAKLFDDHAAAARERDTLRAHALKLDGLCERALAFMGKAYASWDLAIALRARGEVPR